MKSTHIGTINHGIDGHDAYYLLELEEGDPNDDQWIESTFSDRVWIAHRGPGTLFTSMVEITPHPLRDDTRIGYHSVGRDC